MLKISAISESVCAAVPGMAFEQSGDRVAGGTAAPRLRARRMSSGAASRALSAAALVTEGIPAAGRLKQAALDRRNPV